MSEKLGSTSLEIERLHALVDFYKKVVVAENGKKSEIDNLVVNCAPERGKSHNIEIKRPKIGESPKCHVYLTLPDQQGNIHLSGQVFIGDTQHKNYLEMAVPVASNNGFIDAEYVSGYRDANSAAILETARFGLTVLSLYLSLPQSEREQFPHVKGVGTQISYEVVSKVREKLNRTRVPNAK